MRTQNTFSSRGVKSGQWAMELDGSLFGESINSTFVIEYDVVFSRNDRASGSFDSERLVVEIVNPRVKWDDCSLFFGGSAATVSDLRPRFQAHAEKLLLELFEEQMDDVIIWERDKR